MFEVKLDLEEVKSLLVPTLFPSEEDGNPDDYDIEVSTFDTIILTLKDE